MRIYERQEERVPERVAAKYSEQARRYWDLFYARNGSHFFKDRHYFATEWPLLARGPLSVLEVGCGAGNSVYPLLELNPECRVWACDFSPRAVELVRNHEGYACGRVTAFVADITEAQDLEANVPPGSIDCCTLVFVLSAIAPCKMPRALAHLASRLKPGIGRLLLRDYAEGDLAQERLEEKGAAHKLISESFYVRGDGTCCYYFSEDGLRKLLEGAGFALEALVVHEATTSNRKLGICLPRRWIQAQARLRSPQEPRAQDAPALVHRSGQCAMQGQAGHGLLTAPRDGAPARRGPAPRLLELPLAPQALRGEGLVLAGLPQDQPVAAPSDLWQPCDARHASAQHPAAGLGCVQAPPPMGGPPGTVDADEARQQGQRCALSLESGGSRTDEAWHRDVVQLAHKPTGRSSLEGAAATVSSAGHLMEVVLGREAWCMPCGAAGGDLMGLSAASVAVAEGLRANGGLRGSSCVLLLGGPAESIGCAAALGMTCLELVRRGARRVVVALDTAPAACGILSWQPPSVHGAGAPEAQAAQAVLLGTLDANAHRVVVERLRHVRNLPFSRSGREVGERDVLFLRRLSLGGVLDAAVVLWEGQDEAESIDASSHKVARCSYLLALASAAVGCCAPAHASQIARFQVQLLLPSSRQK